MRRKMKTVKVMLRVPPPMKEWLQAQADENLTSTNAEAVKIIRARMESEQPAVG